MTLSVNVEYAGSCREALKFYEQVFTLRELKTYEEFPDAAAFNLNEEGRAMIWKATLDVKINGAATLASIDMSDSIISAMQLQPVGGMCSVVPPTVCLSCPDENFRSEIKAKLQNKEQTDSMSLLGFFHQNSGVHGINLLEEDPADNGGLSGAFHYFAFNGYCASVVDYYSKSFDLTPVHIQLYKNSPHANEINGAGGDKIYSAIFHFPHNDGFYALKIKDTLDSAIKNTNSYRTDIPTQSHCGGNPVFTLRDNNPEYLTKTFAKLAEGVCAKMNKPITTEANGLLHGSLIDSFGICWEFRGV